MSTASNQIATFSSYIDGKIMGRLQGMDEVALRAELLMMHRTIKVAEEAGEIVDKLIGLTGANPRKGVYATEADVVEEILDGAVALVGVAEHFMGNEGEALAALERKIGKVYRRAELGTIADAVMPFCPECGCSTPKGAHFSHCSRHSESVRRQSQDRPAGVEE